MSTVGIIAEYNPFHKGHEYQIQKAKQLTGAEHVVIIMSGNYVQRGEPAILDKYTRAKHALQNGASLVLELPVCYSTSSAELFAFSSVSMLNKLGIVDFLSFGCETDDITNFNRIASVLVEEPQKYKTLLKTCLSQGDSYPVARKKALCNFMDNPSISFLLETPNNILAIEYMKALIQTGSNIKPIPVTRTDNGYHSKDSNSNFASATAIREQIFNGNINFLKKFVPENTLQQYATQKHYLNADNFSHILADKLIYKKNPEKYYDISDSLANRISNLSNNYTTYYSFIDMLLTKNETATHISRALMHMMLEISKDDIIEFKENGTIFYANPLALDLSDTILLKKIKNNTSIALINKFGDFYKKQTGYTKRMLDISLKADSLYNYIYYMYNGQKLHTDFTIRNTEKGIIHL